MRQFLLMLVVGASLVGCCKNEECSSKDGSCSDNKKEAMQPGKDDQSNKGN